jgi:hypothetical protein
VTGDLGSRECFSLTVTQHKARHMMTRITILIQCDI